MFTIDCLIYFSGMLNSRGLFYAKRLENRVHYTFIFTFFYGVDLKDFFFLHLVQSNAKYFETGP